MSHLYVKAGNEWIPLATDESGHIILSDTSAATTNVKGWDGSDYQYIAVDSDGKIAISDTSAVTTNLRGIDGTTWRNIDVDTNGRLVVSETSGVITHMKGLDGSTWTGIDIDSNGRLVVSETSSIVTNIKGYDGTNYQNIDVDSNGRIVVSETSGIKTNLYGYDGSDWCPVQLDFEGEGLITSTHREAAVHAGKHYYVGGYDTINDGESIVFSATTPIGRHLHMTFRVISNDVLTTEVYESCTVTGGSSATPLNSNRKLRTTLSSTVVSRDPTVSWEGNLLDSAKVGSEGFKESFGGTTEDDDETILDSDLTYVYKFISGGDSNVVSFKGAWIEVIN